MGEVEDILRIGQKVISLRKIMKAIHNILKLRSKGASQQEVADELGVDRSFVSRLEALGQIRKGKKVAIIGFPVANKTEIEDIASDEGVEFCYLLTDKERWKYVKERSGAKLINDVMGLLYKMQEYDVIIIIGSDMRVDLADRLVDAQIIAVQIGTSPIKGDKYVDPNRIRELIKGVKER